MLTWLPATAERLGFIRACELPILLEILLQIPKSEGAWGLYRTMEAPPVTVMPVTGGTINMMEYLLQGSVLDQAMESLLHRLRGQDTVSEDMRSFAEQLKPLVHLEKIDPSKQRH
eukprot:XP_011619479.1 PREDICTED: mediator of RNA polymerase II transcription subunit 18 isoform X3 [Takifugu rubripes]